MASNTKVLLHGTLLLLCLASVFGDEEEVKKRVKRQFGGGGDACLQIYSVPKKTVKCEPTDEVVDEFSDIRSVLDEHKTTMNDLSARIDILDPTVPKEIPEEVQEKLDTIAAVNVTQSAHTEILKRLEGEIDRLLQRIETVEADERAEVAELISLQTDLIGSVLERANLSIHDQYIDRLAENSKYLTEKLQELEDNIRVKIETTQSALNTEVNEAESHSKLLVEHLEQRVLQDTELVKQQIIKEQEERARHENETQANAEQISSLEQTIVSLREHISENEAAGARMTTEVNSCKEEAEKLRARIDELAEKLEKREHLVPRMLKVADCQEALTYYHPISGVYTIYPTPLTQPFNVYCDMPQHDQGWTVLFRRQDGSQEFFLGWDMYRDGFGDPEGEYWIGLERMHYMTNRTKYRLRVDVQDWENKWYFAEYDTFHVDSEADQYTLHVGGYHGDAGDSLSYHDGLPFSTMDRNNDINNGICATWCHGAWWYKDCFHSNLNGRYYPEGPYVTKTGWGDGMVWRTLTKSNFYSLQSAVMKIIPKEAKVST